MKGRGVGSTPLFIRDRPARSFPPGLITYLRSSSYLNSSYQNSLRPFNMELVRRIVGMGAKKQAVKSKKVWIKALAIIAGVLFVVLMVVSAMGSSWISSLATIKPGDVVVLDYTLRDAQGTPILTSNQQLYTQLTNQGSGSCTPSR